MMQIPIADQIQILEADMLVFKGVAEEQLFALESKRARSANQSNVKVPWIIRRGGLLWI